VSLTSLRESNNLRDDNLLVGAVLTIPANGG
jgi:hypothetical protein